MAFFDSLRFKFSSPDVSVCRYHEPPHDAHDAAQDDQREQRAEGKEDNVPKEIDESGCHFAGVGKTSGRRPAARGVARGAVGVAGASGSITSGSRPTCRSGVSSKAGGAERGAERGAGDGRIAPTAASLAWLAPFFALERLNFLGRQ